MKNIEEENKLFIIKLLNRINQNCRDGYGYTSYGAYSKEQVGSLATLLAEILDALGTENQTQQTGALAQLTSKWSQLNSQSEMIEFVTADGICSVLCCCGALFKSRRQQATTYDSNFDHINAIVTTLNEHANVLSLPQPAPEKIERI